jgi:hypothetical protein
MEHMFKKKNNVSNHQAVKLPYIMSLSKINRSTVFYIPKMVSLERLGGHPQTSSEEPEDFPGGTRVSHTLPKIA